MTAVTVYTKPACAGCSATKRKLTQLGIPFTEVGIYDDPNTLPALAYVGYSSAPVVFAATSSGEQSWAGYRPDRIDGLAHDVVKSAVAATEAATQQAALELVAEMAAGRLKLLPSAADLARGGAA